MSNRSSAFLIFCKVWGTWRMLSWKGPPSISGRLFQPRAMRTALSACSGVGLIAVRGRRRSANMIHAPDQVVAAGAAGHWTDAGPAQADGRSGGAAAAVRAAGASPPTP